MANIDSTAVFEQRVEALGIKDLLPRLRERLFTTYGSFAFAVPMAANGTYDVKEFMTMVLMPVLQIGEDDPMPPQAAVLRRLFFESHALAMHDLRAKAERTDGDLPRRLPQV